MAKFATNNVRNVCIIGHSGSGKTATIESMLFKAGATDRLGRICDGNTVSSENGKLSCPITGGSMWEPPVFTVTNNGSESIPRKYHREEKRMDVKIIRFDGEGLVSKRYAKTVDKAAKDINKKKKAPHTVPPDILIKMLQNLFLTFAVKIAKSLKISKRLSMKNYKRRLRFLSAS